MNMYSRFLLRRRDSGQGIIFAAATILLLLGFVALVFNIGRVIERRTQLQLAADSAAYSGAMIQADTLSAIGWINSIMTQVHYNAVKYAVDLNVAGVAAELDMRRGVSGGSSVEALRQAYDRANNDLPRAKDWLVRLSQIENSLAILAPRLVQEEMIAVASQGGAERYSFYPGYRMFPYPGHELIYRLEQFESGWRITNLVGADGEMLHVYLEDGKWHILHSLNGLDDRKVIISHDPEDEDHWTVEYYSPISMTPNQVIDLQRTDDFGWIVWMDKIPKVIFEPVDMDGDGVFEGTRITCDGATEVIKMEGGDLYAWNSSLEQYVLLTTDTVTVGDVDLNVNVTNVIKFDGGEIHVGDPTTVDIGNAHIVLSDPPVISAELGRISIAIRGFEPEALNISVGGYSLNPGEADGRWRKYYNRHEELWWRHRLTPQEPTPPALHQWQYDHQWLGTYLKYEDNNKRLLYHVLEGQTVTPAWLQWFDPLAGRAIQPEAPEAFTRVNRSDGSHYYRVTDNLKELLRLDRPGMNYYYQTDYACPKCEGLGGHWVPQENGALKWIICAGCEGQDWDQDDETDIRVFTADLVSNGRVARLAEEPDTNIWDDRLEARLYRQGNGEGILKRQRANRPLVLADEFFKYGINFGVWREKDDPMLFPEDRQPNWGVVALSSSRVGIRDRNRDAFNPVYVYQFDNKAQREEWCDTSDWNLYTGDVTAQLYSSKRQIMDYDLDEDILTGISLSNSESPVAYLYDALLGARQVQDTLTWITKFDGRADPEVSATLRHMRNRQNNDFNYRSEDVEDVITH